ncbi:hypothetical protein JW796_04685 [Candidatus Dojkabacteria bacterium]|nr:hypothetical protein [Candidatus Dojkabacteria bacterium]
MKKYAEKILVICICLILAGFVFHFPANEVFAQELDFNCVREKLLAGEDVSECSKGAEGTGEGFGIETNFFGIKFSPGQEGIARVVRSGITVAFGLLVVLSVFYGIYGIFVRSTAGDSEENMKKSVAIFKNAMLGLIIAIIGFIVVHILSLLLGLGNVWDITFETDFKAAHWDSNTSLSCGVEKKEEGLAL